MCAALNLIRGVHLIEYTFQVRSSPVQLVRFLKLHVRFNSDVFYTLEVKTILNALHYIFQINNEPI